MKRKVLLCGVLLATIAGCIGEVADDSDDESYRNVTPPTHPGPGPCSEEECNGRVAYSTQCTDDDQKIVSRSFPGGHVDLHRSLSCGTTWARVWRKSLSPSEGWVESESGLSGGSVLHVGGFTSTMMYAPDEPVRACVKPLNCKRKACGNELGRTYCTDYAR